MTAHDHHGASATAPDSVTRDPVCGMTVELEAGKPMHEHAGHVYHFCCDGCQTKFKANPADFIEAEDPVCGMAVDPATTRANGLHSHHGSSDYFFCGKGCKLEFDEDPERYLDPSYTPSM